jgi:hypothetical protein
MRGATVKVLDGDGMGFVKLGGGTRLFTGNVFRDCKQGFSEFEGLQG